MGFARAVAADRPILLPGEPTASFDGGLAAVVWQIVAEEKARGKAILCVSHERNPSDIPFDRIVRLGPAPVSAC